MAKFEIHLHKNEPSQTLIRNKKMNFVKSFFIWALFWILSIVLITEVSHAYSKSIDNLVFTETDLALPANEQMLNTYFPELKSSATHPVIQAVRVYIDEAQKQKLNLRVADVARAFVYLNTLDSAALNEKFYPQNFVFEFPKTNRRDVRQDRVSPILLFNYHYTSQTSWDKTENYECLAMAVEFQKRLYYDRTMHNPELSDKQKKKVLIQIHDRIIGLENQIEDSLHHDGSLRTLTIPNRDADRNKMFFKTAGALMLSFTTLGFVYDLHIGNSIGHAIQSSVYGTLYYFLLALAGNELTDFMDRHLSWTPKRPDLKELKIAVISGLESFSYLHSHLLFTNQLERQIKREERLQRQTIRTCSKLLN